MENVELLFQTGWILVALIWSYLHYRKIEYKKLKPGSVGDYLLRVWFACLFAGVSMITIHNGSPDYVLETFVAVGADLVSEAGIFWLVFDLALNLMRPDKKWNYISTTNGKFFDRIFTSDFRILMVDKFKSKIVYKGNWKLQYAAKIGVIVAGETIYYLTN